MSALDLSIKATWQPHAFMFLAEVSADAPDPPLNPLRGGLIFHIPLTVKEKHANKVKDR